MPAGRTFLLDIATEELSHLEVIGSMVAMLNKGVKDELAEAIQTEADLYRSITQGGDSHTQAVLYGGGPALTNSSGIPYIDTIGDPACDLSSNIAAEACAKIVYERLINVTDDPSVKEALGTLMTRQIAHQKSFGKALYSIENNFPPGKLRGMPEFTDLCVNTSQGEGDAQGPLNAGDQWRRMDDVIGGIPVNGGSGDASVGLTTSEQSDLSSFAARTMSNPMSDPTTGAELGQSGAA